MIKYFESSLANKTYISWQLGPKTEMRETNKQKKGSNLIWQAQILIKQDIRVLQQFALRGGMNDKLLAIEDWERLAKEARFRPEAMAGLCFVSLRQLERFFAKAFQTTPRRWMRDLRGRQAFILISQGYSTKAVAAELHYWDEAHFCHDFKRIHGLAPQTFGPRYCGHLALVPQPAGVGGQSATRVS